MTALWKDGHLPRLEQLPDAQSDVIEVLAFGEPMGVPLLASLTDAAAGEQVEARGLIEVYPDGRRLQARLAHPLYGEVQRPPTMARHGTPPRSNLNRSASCYLRLTAHHSVAD